MSGPTNRARPGVFGVEDDLRYVLDPKKYAKQNPGAAPPYVFRYRVTAQYPQPGTLRAELEKHGVKIGSEDELFKLARDATTEQPTDDQIRAAVEPPEGAGPREIANLPTNVRRVLVKAFLPHSIKAERETLQQPELYKHTLYQLTSPAQNHDGIELHWIP
jgi:hypothetical protein